MRILILEDEAAIVEPIAKAFRIDGYAVDTAQDGEEGQFLGATEPYDLVLLDIGLPKIDGLSILKKWRADGITTPVLILTARSDWSDCVDGLDAGADDFLTKPFNIQELRARVRSIIRRNNGQIQPIYRQGDLEFDTRTGQAVVQGGPLHLTAQEQAVLAYLIHNAGRLVSRTELTEHIYEYDDDRDSNTIAVFVARLRKKLGGDFVSSIRGRGYMVAESL